MYGKSAALLKPLQLVFTFYSTINIHIPLRHFGKLHIALINVQYEYSYSKSIVPLLTIAPIKFWSLN